MSIVAECPHCETRFTLQSDLVGKSMRCPNLDCREVFEVRAAESAAPPPPPPPPDDFVLSLDNDGAQPPTSGGVEEFVPVVDAVLASPPSPPPPAPPKPPRKSPRRSKPAPTSAPAPGPDEEVVEAVVVAPPVREVVWTPDADMPAAPASSPGRTKAEAIHDDDEPVLRTRKRKNRAPLILMLFGITTIVAAGMGVLYIFQFQQKSEEKQAEQAKDLYGKAEYAAAAKAYDQLLADFPESGRAEEYRFFADLASTQMAVRSVTSVEDPKPALEKLKGFIAARKDSPLARPEKGRGSDIVDAGRKLGEDIATFAGNRVNDYIKDRSKLEQLSRAEEMVAAGRELIVLVEPFRAKDDRPLDKVGEGLDGVEANVRRERYRLGVIAQLNEVIAPGTADAIEEAKRFAIAKGYRDDPEVQGLISSAESSFLTRVRYEPDPAGPQVPAKPGLTSIHFVAQVGTTQQGTRGQLDEPPVVFLAVARGVLYALDEDTGNLLWASRLGPDVYDPPTIARLDLPEGPTDLAIVPSNVTGQAIVSGIELRTGAVRWQQRLDQPAVGPAAVVGTRAYVPTRGPLGTISVIDLATGTRIGRIVLGQPVSHVVAERDSAYLYVAADSRRLFLFDVRPSNLDGGQPRCVRVIPTDHPPGTLRIPPLLLGGPGDEATRVLVLGQANGPTEMKLRAFSLPPVLQLPAGSPPLSEAIAPDVELSLPGWARFAPAYNGEQLAVVTDAGQFRLFGINQTGNRDRVLFPIPHPSLPPAADGRPVPGLVTPAEEGSYWVITGGSLQKFRRTVLFDRGVAVLSTGSPERVGEPTQSVQLNITRDTAFLVTRSPGSAGCRAMAINVFSGKKLWQRQLGVVPAMAPVPHDGGLLLLDTDGAAFSLAAAALADSGAGIKSLPDWLAASAPPGATGSTTVAVSADGKTAFTLTPTRGEDGPRWVVSRFAEGRLEHTGSVLAPAAPAGKPAVMNGLLIVPAADGRLYRVNPGDGRARQDSLSRGPQWADRKQEHPTAFIAVISDDAFITSDGGRGLVRWVWPKDGDWKDGQVRWEVRDRIGVPPVYFPAAGGRPARLLVADMTGAVWLYDPDRGGQPVRQWIPGRTVSIPAGDVSPGFGVHTASSGRRSVLYSVNGKTLVCLDLDRAEPRWVVTIGDDTGRVVIGVPRPLQDNWLVTDLSGRVAVLSGDTGEVVAKHDLSLPGVVPVEAAVALAQTRVFLPLSDGTAAIVQLDPDAAEPAGKQ